MSVPTRSTVTCPNCGKSIPFVMWESINTEIEDAAKKIISGELFAVECEFCGNKALIDYPILFNDMNHHFFIFYRHEGDEIDECLKLRDTLPGIQARVATNMFRFREKVAIIDAGLDDRIIEILKFFVKQDIQKNNGQMPREIFFHTNDGNWLYEYELGGQPMVVGATKDSYTYIRDYYEPHLDAFDENPCLVDEKWAIEFLTYCDKATH